MAWTLTYGCVARPQDHRNSSSTIPRDAQQVQGPCGVDPGPPGRPQAGSGWRIRKWPKKQGFVPFKKKQAYIFQKPEEKISISKMKNPQNSKNGARAAKSKISLQSARTKKTLSTRPRRLRIHTQPRLFPGTPPLPLHDARAIGRGD